MYSCGKILKCGGSTKGLHIHLRSIHQINPSKRPNTEETNVEISERCISNSVSIRKLDYYMEDASLPAVLARMTACNGLSFNILLHLRT